MNDEQRLDAPNQQVVRPDGSGPADEGTGGSSPKSRRGRRAKRDDEAKQDQAKTEGKKGEGED